MRILGECIIDVILNVKKLSQVITFLFDVQLSDWSFIIQQLLSPTKTLLEANDLTPDLLDDSLHPTTIVVQEMPFTQGNLH